MLMPLQSPAAADDLQRVPWYVVYCKPLYERRAAAALSEILGLAVYLPEIVQRVQQGHRRVALFPRYLFIAVDLAEVGLSRIHAVPGMLGLVSFGDTPQPVGADVIDAIRHQVELLNSTALATPQRQPGLLGGDPLAARPLAGLDVVFHTPMSAEARAHLLIEFLRHTEAAGAPPAWPTAGMGRGQPKRARRTRGRGRPISRG